MDDLDRIGDDEAVAKKLADDVEFHFGIGLPKTVWDNFSYGIDWERECTLVCGGGVLNFDSMKRAAAAIRANYGHPEVHVLPPSDAAAVFALKYSVMLPDGTMSTPEQAVKRIAAARADDVEFHFGIGLPKTVWEKCRKDLDSLRKSFAARADAEETPAAEPERPAETKPFVPAEYTGEIHQIVKEARARGVAGLTTSCYLCLRRLTLAELMNSGHGLDGGVVCCDPCYGKFVQPTVGESDQ